MVSKFRRIGIIFSSLLLLIYLSVALLCATVTALANEANNKKMIAYTGGTSFSIYVFDDYESDGKKRNDAYSVGLNSFGQLGNDVISSRARYQAKKMDALGSVKQIQSGKFHCIALDQENNIYTWGLNRYGQLGAGNSESIAALISSKEYIESRDVITPKLITLPRGAKAVKVAAGESFSMALDSDGNVWTWGSNMNGQLGTGAVISNTSFSCEPQMVKGLVGEGNLGGIVDIAAGSYTAMALSGEGELFAWGSNYYSLISNSEVPTTGKFNTNLPHKVTIDGEPMQGVKSVQLSGDNALALTEGDAYLWGQNLYGQVGNGKYKQKNVAPTKLTYFDENNITVTQYVLGAEGCFALTDGGVMYGWGRHSTGSLGLGTYLTDVPDYAKDYDEVNGEKKYKTFNEVLKPVAVDFSGKVKDESGGETDKTSKVTNIVSAVGNRGFALCDDGEVWGWGDNTYGQVGGANVPTENTYKPVKTALNYSSDFDATFKSKNYMIVPVIVVCLTIVGFTALMIVAEVKDRKIKKLEAKDLELLNEKQK